MHDHAMSTPFRPDRRQASATFAALLLAGCQAPALTRSPAGSDASATDLARRWAELRTAQPRLSARDAARQLGASEAQLVAAQVGGGATRLRAGDGQARDIMARALDLGPVMALTRNEHGVLECTGIPTRLPPEAVPRPTGDPARDAAQQARQRDVAGGYLGGPIDLRFHFAHWHHAYAVVQPGRDGAAPGRSLQFFDAHGDAVHKLYVKSDAGVPVFERIAADFRHADQGTAPQVQPVAAPPVARPDGAIDVPSFQAAWNDMTDVHQFSRLLAAYGLTREQALRLAPAGSARRVAPRSLRSLLDGAAARKIPIMVFLGNPGVTQIYSGPVAKTAAAGDWYNVLDPDVDLHLRETGIASAWVLQRGNIHSAEFFDRDGVPVVSFFGVRERGRPQPEAWTALLRSLPA